MMKETRRFATMLLALSMIFYLLTMIGCQRNHEPHTSKPKYSYHSMEIDLPLGKDVSYQSLHIMEQDDQVEITAVGFITHELGNQPVLVRCDMFGKGISVDIVDLNESAYIPYVYTVTSTGDFYYLQVVNEVTSVIRYRNHKKEVIIDDVSELFVDDVYINIRYISVDSAQNLYFASDSEVIVVLHETGEPIRIPCEGVITNIVNSKSGTIYIQYHSDKGDTKVCQVDISSEQLHDIMILGLPSSIGIEYFVEDDSVFYVDNGEYLYSVISDEKDKTAKPICNWINSDVIHEYIRDILVINNNYLAILYSDSTLGDGKILLMERLLEEDIPEQYLITVAAQNISRELSAAIVNYNRSSDGYRVIVNDYSKYNTSDDLEAGETALQRDLVSGKIPDVFILSDFSKKQDYLQRNMFANISSLIKDDLNFSEDMLFDCVLSPFEKDGKIYELVSRFTLRTLMSTDISAYNTWDCSSFMKYADNLLPNQYLIATTTPERTLRMLLTVGMSDYIDEERATCTFNSDAFKKMLEFSKKIGTFNFWNTEDGKRLKSSRNIAYSDGTIKLYETEIGSLYDYISSLFMFHFNNAVAIGYPCSNENGIIVEPAVSWAIYNQSSVQKGAWDFIKSMMKVSSFSSSREGNYSIAALKELFFKENTGNNGVGCRYLFGYDGSVTSLDKNEEYRKDQGMSYTISQEDAESFIKLLDQCSARPTYWDRIVDIIMEDASAFFSDTKSIEETVLIIQSRCSTYISEVLG